MVKMIHGGRRPDPLAWGFNGTGNALHRFAGRSFHLHQHQKEESMAEKQAASTSTLAGGEYEADDVLADAEPWEPIETKLVVWSFIIAGIVLVIGLFVVPTSIIH
jgi:hypothetical protein